MLPPTLRNKRPAAPIKFSSVERVAREINALGLVALEQDHVSSHPSLKVVPEIIVVSHHDLGWPLGPKVLLEFFRGKRSGTAEVGLVADAADVEDRARAIRSGQFEGGFRCRGIELRPVEFLALEDASAEFVERDFYVRLVRNDVLVWFCTHCMALEVNA
jgi:hypothetical protein